LRIVISAYLSHPTSEHSFKNQTGDRTGEVIGLGFYRSDHWFTGSMSGFLKYNIYIILVNSAKY
jgi:hypothetical protein